MEKGEGIKGERRGRKGDGRRESRIPCPPFKLAPIRLDTLLINRYNEPIYFMWGNRVTRCPELSRLAQIFCS